VTTPGETIPDLIGNYAVMRLADRLLFEKMDKLADRLLVEKMDKLDPFNAEFGQLWNQRKDVIIRCADIRTYITERMRAEDVDTVEANGLVATLKPVNYAASGWLVEVTRNGEKI